jgi:LEA14-like dessication related protein
VKKVILAIFLLFLGLCLAFLAWRFIGYSKDKDPDKTFILPRLGFAYIKVSKLSARETKMTSVLLLNNHLPFPLGADSISFIGSIEGKPVMSSTYPKSMRIAALDSSFLVMPVTVNLKDLVNALDKLERKDMDSVDYEMYTEFYVGFPFNRKFKRRFVRHLPLFHLLRIESEKVEITSLKKEGTTLRVTMSVRNNNEFPITIKDLYYKFYIEGNLLAKGKKEGNLIFPEESTKQISFDTRIPFNNMGETFLKLLKEGKSAAYRFDSDFVILSEFQIIDKCEVEMESTGKLEEILSLKDIKK